ncbi:MAG: hypothetical protein EPN46_05300 [Candidimonas sp.]|nr:MAG: hypothetical protein EPN77_00850 [Candidimonas sp.]TAM21866.1 MAG: hypothetical protein EPN62_13335 [Candidimonas sp.]TAM77891.1 MAG: hypothetical protein EPN46_05300 [Candidimonas sp.]
MKGLVQFLRKLGRLFVDDGHLALALILWCVAAGVVLPQWAAHNAWSAPVFALGCVVVFLVNVARSVGRHRRRQQALLIKAPNRLGR